MMEPRQIEHAFHALDEAHEIIAAVMRPVLVRAIQDPPTMRALGELALLNHLSATWHVIHHLRNGNARDRLPILPEDCRTFEQWTLGTLLEDTEEAFSTVANAPEPQRTQLSTALALAVELHKRQTEPLSLLALTHLLRFALEDTAFLDHVFADKPIEEFLPTEETASPLSKGRELNGHTAPTPTSADDRTEENPPIDRSDDSGIRPTATFFEGKRVRLLVRPEPQLPLMVVDGLCTEISPNHIILVTRDSTRDNKQRKRVILFGMNSVFRISVADDDGRLTQP